MLEALIRFVYVENAFYLILFQVLLVLYLVFRNRKILASYFSDFQGKWLFTGLLLALIGSALPVYYGTLGSRDPISSFYIARDFLSSGITFDVPQYGPFYPFLLALGMSLGMGINSQILLNGVLLFLSSISLILLAYIMVEDGKLAVFSGLIYIALTFFSIPRDYRLFAEVAPLMLSLSLLAMILSYRIDREDFYLLTLLLIGFFGGIKFEFLILLPVFLIGMLLHRRRLLERKELKRLAEDFREKLFLPAFIFGLTGFLTIYIFMTFHVRCWDLRCDALNHGLDYFFIPSYGTPSPFFTLENFTTNLTLFLESWMVTPFLFLVFLSLVSLVYCFRNDYRVRRSFIMLLTFVLLNLPYLFSRKNFSPRYMIYTFVPLIVLSAIAPRVFSRKLLSLTGPDRKKIAVLVMPILLVPFLIHLPGSFQYIRNGGQDQLIESSLFEVSENIECQECEIVVPNYGYRRRMMFLELQDVQGIEMKTMSIYSNKISIGRRLQKLRTDLRSDQPPNPDFNLTEGDYIVEPVKINSHNEGEKKVIYHDIIDILVERTNAEEVFSNEDYRLYRVEEAG